jgi:hypothetical protein
MLHLHRTGMGSRVSRFAPTRGSFAAPRAFVLQARIAIVFAGMLGCGKGAGGAQSAGNQASAGAPGGTSADVAVVDGGELVAADSGADRAVAPARAGRGAAGSAPEQVGAAGIDADADGGGAMPEPGTSVDAIATQLGGAVCDALLACLGPQKLSALFSREPCLTRIAGGLAQDDLAALPDSLQKQRVTLSPEQLTTCYEDTRALGCEVQTQRLPASCQAAIAGHVAIGGVCSIGSDCMGAAFCPLTACPRTCTERGPSGAACSRDEECMTGLLCTGGSCAPPAALGAACAGSSGASCAFGASCVGSTDTKPGECKSNADVQSGVLGAACSPGGTLCQEGLSCAWDGSAAFSCQAAVAANQACHLALPTQCPVEQYCNAKDVMTAGKCVALPVDGAACALGGQCAAGSLCIVEKSKSVCRKLGDLGEPCSQAGLCRSGSCTAGKCTTRAVCP